MKGFGRGGEELFTQVFEPGLNGPVGGSLAGVSRAILMQTVWNLLVVGQWNLVDGVDCFPEALAKQVPVATDTRVERVSFHPKSVEVEAEAHGRRTTYQSRGVIIAVPGHLVAGLCPELPEWITEPLQRTLYSRMVTANVGLRRPPLAPYAGFGFAAGVRDGVELELEHLRAPGRCPEGTGMVSAFFWDTPSFRPFDCDDATVQDRAVQVVERTFPETTGQTIFVHLVRWEAGIAQFPAGRLTEMGRLRQRLVRWDAPIHLCGDYLDGLASEGALRTGERAADQLADRLTMKDG
jgi:oxygen-dependent protoporphyrinogen oxidase